ncbi:MAG: flagellar hook-associated protein FlgK [Halomonadaceae bacterium]|nr:MAG: flagellar hook-associated protein FlgK [Halomonadaceae bacterium]
MSLINIGLTGLQSNQSALSTTGNNVTNANTPGYSRQQVDFAANASQSGAAGFQGKGVSIADIRRLNDEFINTQLRSDTTLHGEQEALVANLRELDNLLGTENTGLSQSIDSYFGALQSAAEDPSSIPLRQQVISQAEALNARFKSIDGQLQNRERTLDQKLSADITEINSLASGIAELNQAIAAAPGRAQGKEANDLLDQRDEKLRELSELVQVRTNSNSDGTINVQIGQGQELVNGANKSQLRLSGSSDQSGRREIMLVRGGSEKNITAEISGGSLGGNLRFRDQVLEPTINSIGRIALGVAEQVNQVHERGSTLDGNMGGLFFSDINDPAVAERRITPASNNAQPDDRLASVVITDTSKLDTRSYNLEFTGPTDRDYQLRDAVTGVQVQGGKIPQELPATISGEGFAINLQSGSFQQGDSFQIRPTFAGARDFAVALERPQDLALGSPIKATTGTGNQGTGSITQGEMLDVRDPVTGRPLQSLDSNGNMSPPLTVRFISDTRFEVLDATDPANPKPLNPPMNNQRFNPGSSNDLFATDPGARSISSMGNALGIIGSGDNNGFAAQELTVRNRDSVTGKVTETTVGPLGPDASARDIANALSNSRGVSATAYTEVRLADIGGAGPTDLTVTVGGQAVTLTVTGELNADSINQAIADSEEFAGLGLVAKSDGEGLTLLSDRGDDITVALDGAGTLDVQKINPYDRSVATSQALASGGNATVGGVVDVTLADGVRVNANNNEFFRQSPASSSAYTGFQFQISGRPVAGDSFDLRSNPDGTADNRNGLALGSLKNGASLGRDGQNFGTAYASVVEAVGSATRSAQIDEEAARTLKRQSEDRWQSASGVNLDEEAGKLIQYQAAYNASAQVVSIARDLFDTLLGTFR